VTGSAPSRSAPRRRDLPTSPFRRIEPPPATTDGLAVGGRVTHDHFGLGRIVVLEPEFLHVDFGGTRPVRLRAGSPGWLAL